MRGMAIVAGGVRMMARLLPAVVMIAHDVAVVARAGIVAEVREPLPIDKGKAACAQADADQSA